ncbi:MAG: lauroyl acyltransferase [Alphaproteobacteria bacterium]|nr:lauroyl acyltransferase [Alphaproteobacteria bacterium]
MINRLFKNIFLYPIEALIVFSFAGIFYMLPGEKASALGGWLSRKVGPFSAAQKTGLKNLQMAYPKNTTAENLKILENVWDNFGRVMGEYMHLKRINVYKDPRIEIIGAEHIDRLREDGKPAIIFGAHLASWELAIMGMTQRGLNVTQTYRAWNNPYIDRLVRYMLESIGRELLAKGSQDGRRIIELMKNGEHLFLLVDQKFNKGMPIPFFGKDAMTAPAGARLAMKFDCPFVPARVERLKGFSFRITYYPPLTIQNTGDLHKDLQQALKQMNGHIEDWVKDKPDQWLWIHNRWPKDSM